MAQIASADRRRQAKAAADALTQAFFWGSSKEGSTYWSNIRDRLESLAAGGDLNDNWSEPKGASRPFVAGDVVRLKSGGPNLTVESITSTGVAVVWMDGGEMKRMFMGTTALRHI